MSVIAKSNGRSDFEKAPTGMQHAVCVFVNDIGLQKGQYQGKDIINHTVIVTWELTERMSQGDNAGRRFMMSKYYTLSLHEKANLRKDLESWRGKPFTEEEINNGFDIERLIGANCFLNVVATEDDKRKISAITPLAKNMPRVEPEAIAPSDKFREWIDRERGKAIQPETSQVHEPSQADNDDLPF